ncbi:hypothetical protein pb186bvf_007461 [Paramecium bursaria]
MNIIQIDSFQEHQEDIIARAYMNAILTLRDRMNAESNVHINGKGSGVQACTTILELLKKQFTFHQYSVTVSSQEGKPIKDIKDYDNSQISITFKVTDYRDQTVSQVELLQTYLKNLINMQELEKMKQKDERKQRRKEKREEKKQKKQQQEVFLEENDPDFKNSGPEGFNKLTDQCLDSDQQQPKLKTLKEACQILQQNANPKKQQINSSSDYDSNQFNSRNEKQTKRGGFQHDRQGKIIKRGTH